MPKELTSESILKKTRAKDLKSVIKQNLWGIGLEDISILSQCVNLQILSLSFNSIKELDALANCSQLQELYLRKNEIKSLDQLNFLKHMKNQRILWISENPSLEIESDYRVKVLQRQPQLYKLDNVNINSSEKEKAHELRKTHSLDHKNQSISINSSNSNKQISYQQSQPKVNQWANKCKSNQNLIPVSDHNKLWTSEHPQQHHDQKVDDPTSQSHQPGYNFDNYNEEFQDSLPMPNSYHNEADPNFAKTDDLKDSLPMPPAYQPEGQPRFANLDELMEGDNFTHNMEHLKKTYIISNKIPNPEDTLELPTSDLNTLKIQITAQKDLIHNPLQTPDFNNELSQQSDQNRKLTTDHISKEADVKIFIDPWQELRNNEVSKNNKNDDCDVVDLGDSIKISKMEAFVKDSKKNKEKRVNAILEIMKECELDDLLNIKYDLDTKIALMRNH